MKIAFALRHYHKAGGISRYVAELAGRYADNNEVHIFTSSWNDVENGNINFHKVPMLSFRLLKKFRKYAWNNFFEVTSFILVSYFMLKYDEYDIVHIQGDFLGRADIYTAHSCHKAWLNLAREEEKNLIGKIKKSGFNPLHYVVLKAEKANVEESRKVVAISTGIKNELMEYQNVKENKVTVIPNGVDIEEFNPDKDIYGSEIREKHGLAKDDFVIIFPAHEFKRKGLIQIIETMSILSRKNVYLLVVGKDNPKPYIGIIEESGLKNNVVFTGPVSDISKYYSASDVFILPAAYEPFGLVILEAMASGLPVVTSEKVGAAELIDDGTDGLLLKDEKNAGEISQKVLFLLDNFEARKSIGNKARKKAEKYSWDIIAEKTFKLYKEISSGKR